MWKVMVVWLNEGVIWGVVWGFFEEVIIEYKLMNLNREIIES